MKGSKPTRMEDIARMAGVAKSTVSKALHNDPSISAATRRRITQIARSAGYRSNPLVSALMTQVRTSRPPRHRPTIAYISLIEQADYLAAYQAFPDGARARCTEMGYRLDEFSPLSDGMPITRLAEVLYTRRIGGMILSPKPHGVTFDAEILRPLYERFAVALIGYTLHTLPLHRASSHQFFCIFTGLRKLAERGYRRPALVEHRISDAGMDYQFSGAVSAFQAQRRDIEPVHPLLAPELSRDIFLRWFEKKRPDAVLTGEPLVRNWLEKEGLRIPRDVAFALTSVQPETGVAGIDQHFPVVGAAAADLVIGQLQRNEFGVPRFPKSVLIEGDWVDGPSAPPREE